MKGLGSNEMMSPLLIVLPIMLGSLHFCLVIEESVGGALVGEECSLNEAKLKAPEDGTIYGAHWIASAPCITAK